MCQLLGLSSNKKVNIQFSLIEFRNRSKQNQHGWGFAFNQDGDWNIIKEPHSLLNEDIKERQFQFTSEIIIGHVRKASCGEHVHKNTHPFKTNNWVFAHNGTVRKIIGLPEFSSGSFKPSGSTDSEYAFCYLLEKLRNNSRDIREILQEEANKIKRYGKFNFLLSDGETLFAHGDNSLYYVQRKFPFKTVTLKEEQYSVNLEEIKDEDEKAIIIATEPLTVNEDWQKITGIKIFKAGEET